MALIPEDGTGLATADSYLSLTAAGTYFTAHGSPAAWTGATDAVKEDALRKATAWLDGQYRWVGSVVQTTQALGWPRYNAIDEEGRLRASDVVPQQIKDACCEVALAHINSSLTAALARGGQVQSETVGAISVTYQNGAPAESTFPYVRRLLRGLIRGGVGMVILDRA